MSVSTVFGYSETGIYWENFTKLIGGTSSTESPQIPSWRPGSFSFAQRWYSNQWSNREMLLLLIENWYQYPGKEKWNIFSFANFCMVVSTFNNSWSLFLLQMSSSRKSANWKQDLMFPTRCTILRQFNLTYFRQLWQWSPRMEMSSWNRKIGLPAWVWNWHIPNILHRLCNKIVPHINFRFLFILLVEWDYF